ncbi:MAG: N-acetyltransferase [bacterium]|nr:N-acetyltransferase [bacterium]
MSKLEIRQSLPGDVNGIEQLYSDAFPDEDLLPLVKELLDLEQGVVSLVGIGENAIVGHISFTFCRVEGASDIVALLAPLAVTPALQKQGIGRALIQTGFEQIKQSDIAYVFVLGDPAFYARFGFKAEDKVATPYPLPAKWHGAWQSIRLCDVDALHEGMLLVPELWRHMALWTD